MRYGVATALAGLLLTACGASAFARPAVTSNVANLHRYPGIHSPIVAIVAPGAPIDVDRCKRSWCRVSANAGLGFLARSAIAFGGGLKISVPASAPVEARHPNWPFDVNYYDANRGPCNDYGNYDHCTKTVNRRGDFILGPLVDVGYEGFYNSGPVDYNVRHYIAGHRLIIPQIDQGPGLFGTSYHY